MYLFIFLSIFVSCFLTSDFSVMYLICGLFCFALDSSTRELALLTWSAVSRPQMRLHGRSNLLRDSSGEGPHPGASYCSPVLHLLKEKVKVTPFKFASYSSNLFLFFLPFPFWGHFLWLQPKASMTEPMAHIACFAHLGNVSKMASIF